MTTSALSYASRLCQNNNKGPLGTDQLFDTPNDVSTKSHRLYELLCKARNAIVHTGAGVSTGAGIPDFRGPSGVWTVMKRMSKKRKRMTDGDCAIRVIENNPVVYGKKRKEAVEFILAMPSEAHLAILELLKAGIIKFVITQNIDGLHALSGLRHSNMVELHGNVFVERCLTCGRRYQRSYVAPTISFNVTGNLCGLFTLRKVAYSICTFPPSGLLTDVVLDWFDRYEDHFEQRAVIESTSADLHISLGTSLHIEPACHYVSTDHYRSVDSPLVIVNYQKTKLDPEADEVIHCDVNKLCTNLLKKFKMRTPVYLRRVVMTVLKYEDAGRCVLLIRLPAILEIKMDSGSVTHYCLCSKQGIHKFVFTQSFTMVLILWYGTQVVVGVSYERMPLFKGEVWEFAIAATDGKKNKNAPRTMVCNNLGIDLIKITEMKIYFNSHLFHTQPCKLIGYLDLIDNTSFNFTHFKLPDSLIILSYLWGTPLIRNLVKDNLQTLEHFIKQEVKFEIDHENNGTKKRSEFKPVEQLCKISNELKTIIQRGLDMDIIILKNDQIVPNLQKLQVNEFLYALESSLELKLFVSKDFQLGELVHNIPHDIKASLSRKGKSTIRCKLSGNVNAFEVIVYQIMVNKLQERDTDLALLHTFHKHIPIWILGYIADLFECR